MPRPRYSSQMRPPRPASKSRRAKRSRPLARLFTIIVVLAVAVGLALTITSMGVHYFDARQDSTEANGPRGPHIDLSDFDPAMLISDSQFYNFRSMDQRGIADFIREKNAGCVPFSMPCLANYTEDTADIPPSPRCKGYSGANGESAATIIYKTAQSCQINPQVLLVLLQKEQGLLTASGPDLTPMRYDIAAGFGCPDGQNCDPQYFGFSTQIYHAAAQFQRYRQAPGQFRFQAGVTRPIPFSPDSTCGAAEVKIVNQATAGLYNYTPYQPDQAVLAGTPGECSSFGNANFYGIFKAWFGNPLS